MNYATPLTFRNARADELDALSKLIRAAYVEYENSYPPAVWPRYYENVGKTRDLPAAAELIVAERDGRIAGCVTYYADGTQSGQGEWPDGWAGILRLALPPDERGAGVGRALVEEAIRRWRRARLVAPRGAGCRPSPPATRPGQTARRPRNT